MKSVIVVIFFVFSPFILAQNSCENRLPLLKEIVGDKWENDTNLQYFIYMPVDVCGSLCGAPLEKKLIKYWGKVWDQTTILIGGKDSLILSESRDRFVHIIFFNRQELLNPPLYSAYGFVIKNGNLIYCDEIEKKSLKKWKKFLKSY